MKLVHSSPPTAAVAAPIALGVIDGSRVPRDQIASVTAQLDRVVHARGHSWPSGSSTAQPSDLLILGPEMTSPQREVLIRVARVEAELVAVPAFAHLAGYAGIVQVVADIVTADGVYAPHYDTWGDALNAPDPTDEAAQ